jgi:DNA-binding beta-propeller fold protein YncE
MKNRFVPNAAAVLAAFFSLCALVSSGRTSAAPLPPFAAFPGVVQNDTITSIASTVPNNGDVNPYGMAVVPKTTGSLVQGDVLISNFNNAKNLQGTGTTIMEISPGGHVTQFAKIDPNHLHGHCPGGVGLTTALFAARSGWVFVGSLPTRDGMSDTASAGCVIVLNSIGQVAETFYGSLINGPWDMTGLDNGSHVALWVTNVLNGTVQGHGHIVNGGTVLRLNLVIPIGSPPYIASAAVIGSGFPERTDPGALVIGPTGVALSPDGNRLFVADSLNDRIAALQNPLFRTTSAGLGDTVTMGKFLNDPLGLVMGPHGDILSANGDNGYLVTTTISGAQIRRDLLDGSGSPPGAGALFGLAFVQGQGLYFVDDATNTLDLFTR